MLKNTALPLKDIAELHNKQLELEGERGRKANQQRRNGPRSLSWSLWRGRNVSPRPGTSLRIKLLIAYCIWTGKAEASLSCCQMRRCRNGA